MNRLEVITDAYLLATGKPTPPATGTKRDRLTGLVRMFYRGWQIEPYTEWDSLYQIISAGKVSARDTFELDTEIHFISTDQQREHNFVRIVTASGYEEFKTVKPSQLYQYRNAKAVAKVADNAIKFSKAFASDSPLIGLPIEVPAIGKLDDLDSDTDEVLIDDPSWLSVRVAAEYVLTDTQLNYLRDDLMDQADEKMIAMKDRNNANDDSLSTGENYFASQGNVYGGSL